jgi:hypothetical protein
MQMLGQHLIYRTYTLVSTKSFLIFESIIFFILGGAVQFGALGTAATNRPIGSSPGDCDGGEIGGMIGRGNRSSRRKPTPNAALSTTNRTCCPDANPGSRGGKPATNRLSYGTAYYSSVYYNTCSAVG